MSKQVNSSNTLIELGLLHQKQGHLDNAKRIYQQVLSLNSNHFDALHLIGIIEYQTSNYEKAVEWFIKALKTNSAHAACYYNLGNAQKELNQLEQALDSYSKSIVLNSNDARCFSNQGFVLRELGRFEEALESFKKSISIKPDYAIAYLNCSEILLKFNKLEESLKYVNQCLEMSPNFADAYNVRGIVLKDMGKLHESIQNIDRSLEINPIFADALWNKSNTLLLIGDFKLGWQLYESRFISSNGKQNKRNLIKPLWLGEESIHGKTLFVHSEQGLGDTIQFIRYIPMVIKLGAKVIVEIQKPLLNLLQGLDGISWLVTGEEPKHDFDFHCPLLSLPLAFKTTIESIPVCPEFSLSEQKITYWKKMLGMKEKYRVGLVWSGGARPDEPKLSGINERRNLPLGQLKILKNIDVRFISLQKGEPAESEFKQQIVEGWDGPIIDNFVQELNDFSDTAALIANLDLVISVDTSTAHLAASLGKPVWLLNRFDTCWRWLLDREDSPWYPTMKIYRQARMGDWESVMFRVRGDLIKLVENCS